MHPLEGPFPPGWEPWLPSETAEKLFEQGDYAQLASIAYRLQDPDCRDTYDGPLLARVLRKYTPKAAHKKPVAHLAIALLRAGANPFAPMSDGETPFTVAVFNKRTRVVAHIMKHGDQQKLNRVLVMPTRVARKKGSGITPLELAKNLRAKKITSLIEARTRRGSGAAPDDEPSG